MLLWQVKRVAVDLGTGEWEAELQGFSGIYTDTVSAISFLGQFHWEQPLCWAPSLLFAVYNSLLYSLLIILLKQKQENKQNNYVQKAR